MVNNNQNQTYTIKNKENMTNIGTVLPEDRFEVFDSNNVPIKNFKIKGNVNPSVPQYNSNGNNQILLNPEVTIIVNGISHTLVVTKVIDVKDIQIEE